MHNLGAVSATAKYWITALQCRHQLICKSTRTNFVILDWLLCMLLKAEQAHLTQLVVGD